jgi:hypothetical protein
MQIDVFVAKCNTHFGIINAEEFVTDDLSEKGVLQYGDGSGCAFSYGDKVIYGGESFRGGCNGAGEIELHDENERPFVTLCYDADGSMSAYVGINEQTVTHYADAEEGLVATLQELLG